MHELAEFFASDPGIAARLEIRFEGPDRIELLVGKTRFLTAVITEARVYDT